SPAALGPAVLYPDAAATLPDLLERQACSAPDAIAVVTDDDSCRYEDLLARATRVAAALTALGVGPGQVVGVCAERSLDMVTGLVGTVLAGAAYLPLDPSLPQSRLAFMVRDAGVTVAVAQPEFAAAAREAGVRHVPTPQDPSAAP